MSIEVRKHVRNLNYAVDAERCLQLFEAGCRLEEIRSRTNPDVSLATISRALGRARKAKEEVENTYA
jgi:hypothetical protein